MPSAADAPTRTRSIAVVAALMTIVTGWGMHQAPPAQAAAIAAKIAPLAAPTGTGITVAGDFLTDVNAVTFLGTPDPADDVSAPQFIAVDPKKLVVQVPAGAETGPVEVTTPDGSVATPVPFTVLKAPVVTAVSTTWAKPDEVITITGTNLMGVKVPAVVFGAKKVAPLLGSTQTELQVKVPSGLAGGPLPLAVTHTGGTARTSFYIAPAVKSITPASGTTAGGTVASILGSGFTGVTNFSDDPATAGVDERLDGVTIGGTRVTKLISVSDKEVVVKVPPGTDAAAPVVVRTTAGGTIAESGDLVKYAYRPLPAVTSVSQNWNAINTPTPVVFTGVNLTETTAVYFGALAGTDVVADPAAGTLTVTPPVSPKVAVVPVNLINTDAAGVPYKVTVPFAYVSTPVVTKVGPVTGPEGTTVAIAGTSFGSGTKAYFGATEANCTITSAVLLTCKAPAGTDVVDVTVDNGLGVSPTTLATKFTYTAGVAPSAPVAGLAVVSPLLPAYGATGSTVDLRGANMHTATKVEFTGEDSTWVEAADMLAVAPGRLVVTVPADAVTGELRVTTPAGRVETLGRVFTKTVPPSVDTINVVGDTLYGATPGDLLEIKGSGLLIRNVKTEVTIGGKPASILLKPVPSSSTLIVRVPPSIGGREAVTVKTPLGSATSEVNLYQIPEVKVIKPVTYTRTGGTVATLSGFNFTGVDDVTVMGGRLSAVTFGGVPVSRLVFMNDKTLVAVTSPGSATADRVVVTTQHDGRFGTSDGKTRSVDAPIAVINSVSPDTGPTGTTPPAVTITGQHLKLDSIVKFGANTATVQSAAPDGTSMVVIPPSRVATATVPITITNFDDGDALTTTKAAAYTYVLQPAVITGLSVATAVPGTQITVSGTSFVDVSSVTFDGIAVPYTVANSTTIFATVPATPTGAAGTTAQISVVNGTGQPSTAEPATANDWMWDNSPTLVSLSSSTGASGTAVTINGSNFAGVTRVRFGYTDATSYTVVDANTITAVVPVTPAGQGGQVVDVVVEVNGLVSRSATAAADNWTWMSAAVITAMSQNTAPAGTTVTVTGSGFASTRSVQIHSKNVTSYTVLSDTSLTFVVPPSDASGPTAAGSKRDVRIANGSGLVSTANPLTADDWTFQ